MFNTKKRILKTITKYYLESSDCNGIDLRSLSRTLKIPYERTIDLVSVLVKKNMIFLQSGTNPFIVTQPDISINKQLLELLGAKSSKEEVIGSKSSKIKFVTESSGIFICLYPKEQLIKEFISENEPIYQKLFKLGNSQLRIFYFLPEVLQAYKSDPRYNFSFEDFSGIINTKNDVNLPEEKKITGLRFGLALNKNKERRIAVLLRDLSDLTFSQQINWNSYQVEEECFLVPEYAATIFYGDFNLSISIYSALIEEINYVYDLSLQIYGISLFNKRFDKRDELKDCQFLFIPTSENYNNFLLLLEKMLPGNINKKFFKDKIELAIETKLRDNKIKVDDKGTIVLLNEWLELEFEKSNLTSSIKNLRKERQKPAHEITENFYDTKLFNEQKEMVNSLFNSLKELIKLLKSKTENYPETILDKVDVKEY